MSNNYKDLYDKNRAMKILQTNPELFIRLPKNLKNDKDCINKAVLLHPSCFKHMPKNIRDDKKFILDVVREIDFEIFPYLYEKYLLDDDIIMEAHNKFKTKNCYIYRFFQPIVKSKLDDMNDHVELFTKLIKLDKIYYKYTSLNLQTNKSFILNLIKHDKLSYQDVHFDLKQDPDVIREVILNNEGIFLDHKLHDKKLIIDVIKKRHDVRWLISGSLKNDVEIDWYFGRNSVFIWEIKRDICFNFW